MSLSAEHTFTVEHNGQNLTFTFTMPSMRQRTQIGVAEARMRDGVKAEDLDPLTRSLINQLCFLSVTVKCPDGVKFTENTDPYLMNEVFQEVLDYEGRFLDARAPKRED